MSIWAGSEEGVSPVEGSSATCPDMVMSVDVEDIGTLV
jgi:hypothetical protein